MNPKIVSVLVLLGAMFGPIPRTEATEKADAKTPAKKSARLIVQRTPNFGSNIVVRLSVDGKKVADIPRNEHYGDFVSAGRHVLTVLSLPNSERRKSTSIRLNAKSGKVYIFTAAWESDRLILRPSTLYSPTARVGATRK